MPNVSLCEQENEVHYNPYVPPQPIAPVGKVQVFANPQCTEYANGYCKDVWVRLNQGFGFNDLEVWGTMSDLKNYLCVYTPTTEFPDDGYSVECWADFIGIVDGPFTAGQIVQCNCQIELDISDHQKIFE